MSTHDELLRRVENKSARVVVIGVGYVGLPLIVEFARQGFAVVGYDKDRTKVESLRAGRSYIEDVSTEELHAYVSEGRITATTDSAVLAQADVVIVCVPTPLNKTREPDMRYIVAATNELAAHQHAGMLIVLESTTYPGTTREVLVPRLGAHFEIGTDVFVAFSPERVDPGNARFGTRNTPKVLGGTTPACLEVAMALYGHIIERLVPVSSTDTAEMVKLLENTFRAVNIGLVNEVALMCGRLGVDPWEVIGAAATKPFGFMPFYPGPGLGGHCIPIDPLYLSWKLKALKFQARFIELADTINEYMPRHVVERVTFALNGVGKSVRGTRILVAGVAYKKNVSDTRESPALEIIHNLDKLGARLDYTDPHVPILNEGAAEMRSVPNNAHFGQYDLVLVLTDHDAFDWARMVSEAPLIVDTRGALRGYTPASDRPKVMSL